MSSERATRTTQAELQQLTQQVRQLAEAMANIPTIVQQQQQPTQLDPQAIQQLLTAVTIQQQTIINMQQRIEQQSQ